MVRRFKHSYIEWHYLVCLREDGSVYFERGSSTRESLFIDQEFLLNAVAKGTWVEVQ